MSTNYALYKSGLPESFQAYSLAQQANPQRRSQRPPAFGGNFFSKAIQDEVCLTLHDGGHNDSSTVKFGNNLFESTPLAPTQGQAWPLPAWAPKMMGSSPYRTPMPQQGPPQHPFQPAGIQQPQRRMNYGGGATEVDTNPSWTGRAGSGDPYASSWNG